MIADYTFLEYSYNPEVDEQEKIFNGLEALGFDKRAYQTHYTLWVQERCILLVRETTEVEESRITGFGLSVSDDVIANMNTTHDKECDIHICVDPNGLRVFLLSGNSKFYTLLNKANELNKKKKSVGFINISGIVGANYSSQVRLFYKQLGFTESKKGNNYDSLVSSNKAFTIFLKKKTTLKGIDAFVVDVQDVFTTTATLAFNELKLASYDKKNSDFEVQEIHHKLNGYNCIAYGNANTYTIENCVNNPLPNLKVIFRMRKQYMFIHEEAVSEHLSA